MTNKLRVIRAYFQVTQGTLQCNEELNSSCLTGNWSRSHNHKYTQAHAQNLCLVHWLHQEHIICAGPSGTETIPEKWIPHKSASSVYVLIRKYSLQANWHFQCTLHGFKHWLGQTIPNMLCIMTGIWLLNKFSYCTRAPKPVRYIPVQNMTQL